LTKVITLPSASIVREALREWKLRRAAQLQELAALKMDIDKGLAEIASGRVSDFDAASSFSR